MDINRENGLIYRMRSSSIYNNILMIIMEQHMADIINPFKIIHFHNQSQTFHITSQVLIDSKILHGEYNFFYHIMTLDVDQFNDQYGSISFLIGRNNIEADLYLNVHSAALEKIIHYIQFGKIERLVTPDTNLTKEIIDMATIFGMDILVLRLRLTIVSDEQIKIVYDIIELFVKILAETYDRDIFLKLLNYLQQNKSKVIDKIIKPYYPYLRASFFFKTLLHIIITIFDSKNSFPDEMGALINVVKDDIGKYMEKNN